MSEKKGFWKSLFGGGSSSSCCNMQITEEKKGGCCDMQIIEEEEEKEGESGEDAPIQVLGAGCKNCVTLEQNVKTALAQLGRDDTVAHITDAQKIVAYGVMSVPALVIKGKVVSTGKVLKPEEIKKLIQENL